MEERRPPSPSSHPPPVFVYTSHHVGSIPIGTSRVRIDASVTRIPPMAFVPLGPDLLELEFDPSGNLLEIGRRAFHGCVNATFRADTNLPRTISVIQDEAFGSCRSLTEVNIPPGVIAIRGGTFRDCSSLSRCYLPPTVRVIMSDALGSTSIDDGFVLPRDIDEIGDAAFRDAKFRRMIIPSSISVIGRHPLLVRTNVQSRIVNEYPSYQELRLHGLHNVEKRRHTPQCRTGRIGLLPRMSGFVGIVRYEP